MVPSHEDATRKLLPWNLGSTVLTAGKHIIHTPDGLDFTTLFTVVINLFRVYVFLLRHAAVPHGNRRNIVYSQSIGAESLLFDDKRHNSPRRRCCNRCRWTNRSRRCVVYRCSAACCTTAVHHMDTTICDSTFIIYS